MSNGGYKETYAESSIHFLLCVLLFCVYAKEIYSLFSSCFFASTLQVFIIHTDSYLYFCHRFYSATVTFVNFLSFFGSRNTTLGNSTFQLYFSLDTNRY